MPCPADEGTTLLAVKGVGPTVVDRLEGIGIDSLAALAATQPEVVEEVVVAEMAAMRGARR
jgi:predicted RecB family nuclease